MKLIVAMATAALLLSAAPASARSKAPAGCVTCESLCVTCSKILKTGASHICRATCGPWAARLGITQVYVRPDTSLCGTASFAPALCTAKLAERE
jgi:hypothetical protein